jgi:hypothetical protein
MVEFKYKSTDSKVSYKRCGKGKQMEQHGPHAVEAYTASIIESTA